MRTPWHGGATARRVLEAHLDEQAAAERAAFFDAFLGHLGRSLGSVVFVVGRPGGLALTDDTRDWHESAVQAARREGVELIATYLATGEGVVLLPTLTEQGLAS